MGVRAPKPSDRDLAAEVAGKSTHGAGRQETAMYAEAAMAWASGYRNRPIMTWQRKSVEKVLMTWRRQKTAMYAEAAMARRRPLSRAGPPRPG